MSRSRVLVLSFVFLVSNLAAGCSLLAGARLSAGPALDTDGHVGVELAMAVSWGMSNGEGTPTVDEHALLETVHIGGTASAAGSAIVTSVSLEYVQEPLRLGLGIGLRAPLEDDQPGPDPTGQERGLEDALSLELSGARLWNLDHEDSRLIDAGVEFRCGYRFLADIASCTAGPFIDVIKYKRVRFPR